MQVSVSGQHLSIGLSLQEYVKERMGGSIKKYFDHAPSATVHFNKQNHDFSCDIVVNDGTGRHIVIKSNASSDDVYFAFDAALSKIEKQLRKYKSKLKDHSSKMKVSEVIPTTTKYVISPTKIDDELEEKFGIRLRSRGVFATKDLSIASDYGKFRKLQFTNFCLRISQT